MVTVRRADAGDSDDSVTRLGDDLPGENLARPDLADPGEYSIDENELEAEELSPDPLLEVPSGGVDDPAQLEDAESAANAAEGTHPLSLAEAAAKNRPARKVQETAKKDSATARRKKNVIKEDKKANPVEFVGQSVDELKKVVWPTTQNLRQYFGVVLLFVLFIITYVSLLDLGFGAGLLKLFG